MHLLHLVPPRRRAHDGVTGYAAALAGALRDGAAVDGRIHELQGDAAEFFRPLGGTDPVVLHYVGYGYQRRGCPRELVESALAWRRDGGGPLLTLFHEIYATGPPWTSAFWLSATQRSLASRLARASDACVVTAPLFAAILGRWIDGAKVSCIPVPSTVGEPVQVAPLRERARRLVVFGSPGVRERAYRCSAALSAACAALSIEEIIDIGEEIPGRPRTTAAPVRRLGPLPAAEVSAVLAGAFAGFLCYPPALLSKSTVFAAYCAHGVLPLWAHPERDRLGEAPVRTPGCDVTCAPPRLSATELQAAADDARAWYGDHGLARQAAVILAALAAGQRQPVAVAEAART